MEKNTHFTSTQLEEIFAHIKDNTRHGVNVLYRGLVADAIKVGSELGIEQEDARNIFNATITSLVKLILTGKVTVENFEEKYAEILNANYKAVAPQMKDIYSTRTIVSHTEPGKGCYSNSYLFSVNHLVELSNNPELMEKYGITKEDVLVLKSFYSVTSNRLAKVAKDFGIGLHEAQHLVLEAKRKINKVNEQEFVHSSTGVKK